MVSLQSKIVLFFLKHTLLKSFKNRALENQRSFLDKFGSKINMPSRMDVQKITIKGLNAEWLSGSEIRNDQIILYLHGGAYTMGSCDSHRALAARISRASTMRLLLLEYRLAPEFPFPAALDDAVTGYQWLLENGIDPKNIALVGDSAGGGLVIATAVSLRDKGQSLPGAIACLSPWTDLELTGESITTKVDKDIVLTIEYLRSSAARYVRNNDYCAPLISPLYADLSGLPPMLIHVGEYEILLSDSIRLVDRARNAGVNATLKVWKGMWHEWHGFAEYVPESRRAIEEIGDFLRKHIREFA